jgi:hypothetical protein
MEKKKVFTELIYINLVFGFLFHDWVGESGCGIFDDRWLTVQYRDGISCLLYVQV